MLLRRQKTILGALLEASRIPTKTELVKWLFLLKEETSLRSDPSFYDFVPYKYGPFSFTIYRDLEELTRLGYLKREKAALRSKLIPKAREAFYSLPNPQRDAVTQIIHRYSCFDQSSLIKIVYSKYPWYASKSELNSAPKIQSPKRKVAAYIAGYEGESIDLFLQKLLKSGIERIIDVRRNPISRKYGFSKGTLTRLSSDLDIDYVHIPDLGIPALNRQSLSTFEDYQKLLKHYQEHILPNVQEAQQLATQLLRECPSVLMCFESDPRCCHRSSLGESISANSGLSLIHL